MRTVKHGKSTRYRPVVPCTVLLPGTCFPVTVHERNDFAILFIFLKVAHGAIPTPSESEVGTASREPASALEDRRAASNVGTEIYPALRIAQLKKFHYSVADTNKGGHVEIGYQLTAYYFLPSSLVTGRNITVP